MLLELTWQDVSRRIVFVFVLHFSLIKRFPLYYSSPFISILFKSRSILYKYTVRLLEMSNPTDLCFIEFFAFHRFFFKYILALKGQRDD